MRERSAVLPFSIGCNSQSSVEVANTKPSATRKQEKEQKHGKDRIRKTVSFMALPKPNISRGIHKMVRSIRSVSQVLFVYKEEEEEDTEREMEIGYPTDVKHVTHIGADGTTTTNPVKGWEGLKSPEVISFPAISLRQFELSTAAQAQAQAHPHPQPNLSSST
ncbi:hypothetical protein K2173_019272 [Erythroxylum novogranatense]|uniref:CRIB domain-containing protein n=1 Tax=Erythroxylum novogranatense TaxID=1862640 RepID=A0AAV8SUE5_9ROSI|nr:hypothetical protein K2173_019272 [Erythroxylum novogranatense]